VSGWQIFDNKGQVVEKYEPFFSEGWDYGRPDDSKTGQKVVMFYDPRGHAIRTLHPDGSEQRVIFGVPGTIAALDLEHPEIFEPTPWEAYTYDANDNAGRTHPAESVGYQHCWNTPASILIDSLGRTIKAVERNREPLATPESPVEEIVTRTIYDIRGNVLTINDALKRDAFRDHVYDYANRMLRMDSIDAGLRTTVLDAMGGVIEHHDSKGALTLHGYDNLNRPLQLWARDGKDQKLTLRERLEYGDAGSPSQPAAERTNNREANRLGKPIRHFDEAGLLTFDTYDFKGNLLEKTRRVVSDAAILGVFSPPPAGWQIEAFRVNWDTPAAMPLDAQTYTSTIRYDALSRVKLMTYPEDVENHRRKLIPHYNRAGALESVALERSGAVSETFVERIAYNAKGQRILIAYGNGIMTRHAYDPHTFRLLHLRTEGFSEPADLTYRHNGQPLQEFGYEYDLIGNIRGIQDQTPESGVNGSAAGIDLLDREFIYDALYRLRSATGRECDKPPDFPWDNVPRSSDVTKTRSYAEQYLYDVVGNIKQLKHLANGAGFTRDFDLAAGNNRLDKLNIGVIPFGYQYDTNGNMIGEATSRHFEWDHADRMRVYRTQTDTSEPSVHAHYLYDAGGQRVKKLVRKQGGQMEVTVYIDGIFEYQRIVRGRATEENNTLHVMDNQSRIALVRIGNPFASDTGPAVKYHLGDHLGSSNLVLDGTGNLVNHEEYTPYGETSFGSFARKRYRFSGKEKDEESGLSYFGFRYYVPHLVRWTSCDPAGTVDGANLYSYVSDNPIRLKDAAGLAGTDDSSQVATPMEEAAGMSSEALHAVGPPAPPELGERYSIGPYSKFKNIPQSQRTGGTNLEAHHPIQAKWGEQNVVDYSRGKAPTQLLETGTGQEHTQISDSQKANRPVSGDWSEKSFSEARAEACRQYEDAGLMTNEKQGLTALLDSDADFFSKSDKVRTNRVTREPTVQKNAHFEKQMNKAIKMGPAQSPTAPHPATVATAPSPSSIKTALPSGGGPGALVVFAGKIGSVAGAFFHILAIDTLMKDIEMYHDPGSPALGPVKPKRTDSVGTIWIKTSESRWVVEDDLHSM
jgi:RHS repeat-associated protein